MAQVTVGYDVCTGDVDGDGDVDLVIGNDHDPNQLFLNDGRGGFVDATAGRLVTPSTPSPQGWSNSTYEVDLADIDGDGDLDLLVTNDHDVVDWVYTNNGQGFFTDVTATAAPAHVDYGVDQVVADFDGDGDVDWMVCNLGYVRLLLNNGAGVFADAPAGSVPTGMSGDNRSSAVDLDQDGDLDVLLSGGGWYGATPRILVNQGGAMFTALPAAPPLSGLVFAADVDGDGRPDLITQGTKLLRNLGGLTFSPAVNLPGSVVTSADFDRDGDVDLLGANALLVNDGTGAFTPIAHSLTLHQDTACVADLDGDGDADAVSVSWSGGRSLTNFFHQVHTPVAPTLGSPYSIQYFAPVRPSPVFWGPGVANQGGLQPLPGFQGMLRLDPVGAVPLWTLVSTTGLETITWTIPNLAALIGTELHYQAVVVDPLLPACLSNAVRDVIQ
ncbi:MAG: VCBS repeat-containing protein [Planctomycetes bacterium]|nr:VCBS repeat-containing protein [Planctomycetota bacterium]